MAKRLYFALGCLALSASAVSGHAGETYMPMHPGGGAYNEVGPALTVAPTRRATSEDPPAQPQERPVLHKNMVRLKIPAPQAQGERRLRIVDAREDGPDGRLSFDLAAAPVMDNALEIPGLVTPEYLAMDKQNRMDAAPARRSSDVPSVHPAWAADYVFPDSPDEVRLAAVEPDSTTDIGPAPFPDDDDDEPQVASRRIVVRPAPPAEAVTMAARGEQDRVSLPPPLAPLDPSKDLFAGFGSGSPFMPPPSPTMLATLEPLPALPEPGSPAAMAPAMNFDLKPPPAPTPEAAAQPGTPIMAVRELPAPPSADIRPPQASEPVGLQLADSASSLSIGSSRLSPTMARSSFPVDYSADSLTPPPPVEPEMSLRPPSRPVAEMLQPPELPAPMPMRQAPAPSRAVVPPPETDLVPVMASSAAPTPVRRPAPVRRNDGIQEMRRPQPQQQQQSAPMVARAPDRAPSPQAQRPRRIEKETAPEPMPSVPGAGARRSPRFRKGTARFDAGAKQEAQDQSSMRDLKNAMEPIYRQTD